MKQTHFFYFIFLSNSLNGGNKNLHYLIAGSVILFREQISDLLKKNYEIQINEV